MDELRLVRREERSLVVATEAGEEFRLVVDDTVLAELRHLSRRESTGARVRPREIQALIRAGKTRAEVVALTGLDESDIERYEGPVVAEREFILERAHAVPVRTERGESESEQFGAVIAERLESIGAEGVEWSAWRDEETGWMIGLGFRSRDIEHRAVWSFDHRKGVLAPVSPDAVTLSKQGDVGDRLIPKLRAVDSRSEGFDATAFDTDEGGEAPSEESAPPASERSQEQGAPPEELEDRPVDPQAEFERRREIDQRAISSPPADENDNLAHTADLLDALRRRRGERERGLLPVQRQAEGADPADAAGSSSAEAEEAGRGIAPATGRDETLEGGDAPTAAQGTPQAEPEDAAPRRRKPTSGPDLWAAVSSSGGPRKERESSEPGAGSESGGGSAARGREKPGAAKSGSNASEGGRGKRRASIPSWDDILFGTRGDDEQS